MTSTCYLKRIDRSRRIHAMLYKKAKMRYILRLLIKKLHVFHRTQLFFSVNLCVKRSTYQKKNNLVA